ncbi:MAG: sigma 54 modulation protein/ribosomal protein [Deltaproteobacteria bacterium]|jgi:putative sigma-54 modulation protein|nr:sigma 54 modulation protein/ribosomal protein [Deltaproteobacteria bacterium]
MQIAVTFRHMDVSEGVRAYVKEKVEKLEKYIENPQEVHVVLSVEKFRHIAEITIVSDGMTLNSQGRDNDLYAAIDQTVDKMERQIRERRDKGRRKRTNLSVTETPPRREDADAEDRDEGEPLPRIQRRQPFVKPMSPEEAVSQLNLSKEDILFFINSNSGQMNALYRGKNGGYEWVEPQSQ